MYGLVNIAVQELVTAKFGADAWLKIKAKANIPVEEFSRMSPYPDEHTFKLVGAASEVLDIPPDKVLETFGEFWILFTGQKGYGHFFSVAGNNMKEFLFNLDNLHVRVGQSFKQLVPPSFQFDEITDSQVRMHYLSERQGLCPMVKGLIAGLAKMFKTEVTLTHPVCQRNGADHCEFDLVFGEQKDS